MTRREEATLLACALAVLLAGAIIGAVAAMVAQTTGTPTTSERIMLDLSEERPINP